MSSRKVVARKSLSRFEYLVEWFRNLARPQADTAQARIYWGLVAFLVLVFLMGGASRSDVQSLIVLRPLAVIAGGFGLLSLGKVHLQAYRPLIWMAVAVFILAGVHLIPLPPSIWQALPGRDVVVGIDNAMGIKGEWRPLTMTPAAGRNAFFSLFVPLAVLLMAIQLNAARLRALVLPLLIFGVLSGVIGIFQAAGDPHGGLYFYRITNNGSAVGLFSNRNHQAVLLAMLFPLLALFASQSMKTENGAKSRFALAIGVAVMIVPLLLVTGSRLGLILGGLGIASGWFLYRRPEITGVRRRTERKSYMLPVLGGLAVMILGLLAVLASRAEALKRLVDTNVGEEDRGYAWDLASRVAFDHLPVGTGSGSFVEMFQQVEPIDTLGPVYFNHAHNDWLEVWMTFGIPGLVLLVTAVAVYFAGVRKILLRGERRSSDTLMAQAGAVMLLLFAVASAVDYPLRTPSLACLFVIACCWMTAGIRNRRVSLSVGNSDRD